MQSLASTKGRVPNIISIPFGSEYGTLLIHTPDDRWHYFGKEWLPAGGLTKQEFIKTFHMAPPSNVPAEWWGIVQGLTDDIMCRDANWTRAEVQAALDSFVDGWGGGQEIEGVTIRALDKASHLLRKSKIKNWNKHIVPAPMPVTTKVRRQRVR